MEAQHNLRGTKDFIRYMRTLQCNREDIWRILGIYKQKKIEVGNRLNYCENGNDAITEVKQLVNFVSRLLDHELQLSFGCNDE